MIKSTCPELVKNLALVIPIIIYIANVCSVNAQKIPDSLQDRDKREIVNNILLTRTFDDTKYEYGLHVKEVYLSSDNLPSDFSKSLPKIQKAKIILLTEKELVERAKYGFDFYRFDEFKVIGKSIIVRFSTHWLNSTAGEGRSNGTVYKCQKRNKNWKCKAHGFSMTSS